MKLCIDCKYYAPADSRMYDKCIYKVKRDLVRGEYEVRYCDTRRIIDCKEEAIFFEPKEQENVN